LAAVPPFWRSLFDHRYGRTVRGPYPGYISAGPASARRNPELEESTLSFLFAFPTISSLSFVRSRAMDAGLHTICADAPGTEIKYLDTIDCGIYFQSRHLEGAKTQAVDRLPVLEFHQYRTAARRMCHADKVRWPGIRVREMMMKTIGLIGGMSWESTAVYYRRLNEKIRRACGGLHSAEIIMRSVDFQSIVAMQTSGDWDSAARVLQKIARELEAGGADCVLICTNTMHKLADSVQAAIRIPLLNIIDICAHELKAAGVRRPLLLATRYTMEHGFYRERMRQRHGVETIVPEEGDRTALHDIIFSELCRGIVREPSRQLYMEVIDRGRFAGADGVILGCTEIGLLIQPDKIDLPTLDSTLLHADAAVDFALGGGPLGRADAA
jgi:aspartate racemase